MNILAKLAVKVALWALEHPELVKSLVDALHQQKKSTAASAAA